MQIRHFRPTHFQTPGEDKAYGKIIRDLQDKLEARSHSSLSGAYFFIPNRGSYNKVVYAEELKKQISDKKKTKELEKTERSQPAISTNFNGYPNLPKTPEDLKRKNRQELMKQIKESLDYQLVSKSFELKNSLAKDKEMEKKISEENKFKHHLEKEGLIEKKKKQQEILVGSWNLALQTKELQKKLEEVNRKSPVAEVYSGRKSSVGIEQEHLFLSLEKRRKRVNRSKEELKKKMIKMKQSIDVRMKKSYQLKIDKIIKSGRIDQTLYSHSEFKMT